MNNLQSKALEIAVELTNTKLQSSTSTADKANGKSVVDFFNEVYNGIKDILENTNA